VSAGPTPLDARDPDALRDSLPALWLLATLWHRGEVRGLGNVPDDGPVLLVGNGSGGAVGVDSLVFLLAFAAYFGVERPLHVLAHGVSRPLRRFGVVPADLALADRALAGGAAVVVYPGGAEEGHRPVWRRNRIDLGGRGDWIDLALAHGAPVVPLVSIGGQETSLFLGRVRSLPVSLALPWGVSIGARLGHVPLPAKLTLEALPPVDVPAELAAGADRREVHDHVARLMQDTLDALAAERRLPVLG
jgi:1-acyl-sn-glycerol-3-phosphate acyltransferase